MTETDAKEANAEPTLPSSKPPFLRRVQIRGYKSIAFCDVTLEPLTLLVGRNGSGKSNFLDALGFLKDIVSGRLSEAVRNRNGWNSISCKSTPKATIRIDIESEFQSSGTTWNAAYGIEIGQKVDEKIQLLVEQLELKSTNETTIGFYYDSNSIVWIDGQQLWNDPGWVTAIEMAAESYPEVEDTRYFRRPLHDHSVIGMCDVQPFVDFAQSLQSCAIYNFSPTTMRGLQAISSATLISRDGSNLAGMIRELERISPHTISRVNRYLNAIVPDIEFCKAQTYGNYETVRFQMKQIAKKAGLQFDSFSMSDGTLRVLAALVAASQFELSPATGFIAIEEPETSLHPAAMHALVDALDEATLHTQILLTTHSAEMLDNPTIKPANVRVVQMIDGQTVIAPVDEASVEIVKKKLNTLGGLERENQLEPDTDDLERQRKLSLNDRSTTE